MFSNHLKGKMFEMNEFPIAFSESGFATMLIGNLLVVWRMNVCIPECS